MSQVRVLKRAHFFGIDNDIIDVHAKTIGATGMAIYTVLARHANRTTGDCWPSIDRIGRTLDLARSTVKKYLRTLEAVGLIAITKRQDAAGGHIWLNALGGWQPSNVGCQSVMPSWAPGTRLAPAVVPQVIRRQ